MKKLIFLIVLTAQAQAEVCQKFKAVGRFENLADHSRGQVEILNDSDCVDLTLIDNDDIPWTIDLSGAPTPLPEKFLKNEGVHISDAFYTAKLNQNDQIELNFEGNTEMSGPAGIKINARISYSSLATASPAYDHSPQAIQLNTQSLKLIWVSGSIIEKDEESGFVKGANFILDMIKNMLDLELKLL